MKPARMGRYANLGRQKSSRRRSKWTPPGKIGEFVTWWRGLSMKKKIVFTVLPIFVFLITVPIATYIMLANDIKDPERLMNRNNTGIVLQDANGKSFYSVGRAEHRNDVALANISDSMKKALIASEDKDFYKHGGFSPLSILRALVTRTGGGSTLTQQLVKNTLLSDERSYFRKYQELFMAIAVEQNYSKDQILAMYLNSVYFGENAFGVEEAAKVYFNTTPDKLDVAQSAMLVGLLPAPTAYSPISGNKNYAKERQNTVLSRMVKNGFITEDQKNAATAQELVYGAGAKKNETSIAPHFAEMVINQLSKKYSYEKVMRSGYQVKTTLDVSAQQTLTDNIAAQIKYINRMGGSNASGVVIDPTNGEVRALVGSADYNNEKWGKVNMVTTARQTGSSFKPIYYANALADGVITPATVFDDKVKDFGGGYVPRDADRRETSRGKASVRQALNWSLNIPSVEVMQKYGISKSISTAKKLGITTLSDNTSNYGLSLALGSAEVPLVEMVNAYAAFANNGQQYDVTMVSEINNKFGKQIFAREHKGRQAISQQGAYLISNVLSDAATRARIFGSSITVPGNRTVAVKTGTTNDNRDAWTIGYNPQYVVGVWVGNNDNTVMRSGGSDMAGPIFKGTMSALLKGRADVKFNVPSGIVQRAVCRENGGLAVKAGGNTYNEYFMSGALPTESCNAEPTTVSVCNLATGKVESIKEDEFSESKYSKDTANCKAATEQVCDLSTGKVVAINVNEYDSIKYSRDTVNCANNQRIAVCDTQTGKIVTIPKIQAAASRYSRDTANCVAKEKDGDSNDNTRGDTDNNSGNTTPSNPGDNTVPTNP